MNALENAFAQAQQQGGTLALQPAAARHRQHSDGYDDGKVTSHDVILTHDRRIFMYLTTAYFMIVHLSLL